MLLFYVINQRRLYREFGYGSINNYAREELGWSENRICQFIRLTSDLVRLPKLRRAVFNDEIGWTKAKEVTKVANAENENEWLDEAKRLGKHQLIEKVKQARQRKRAARRGNPRQVAAGKCREDLHLIAISSLIDSEVSAAQSTESADSSSRDILLRGTGATNCKIAIHYCESSDTATIQTQQGARKLSRAELEAAKCDAILVNPGSVPLSGAGLRELSFSGDPSPAAAEKWRVQSAGESHHPLFAVPSVLA